MEIWRIPSNNGLKEIRFESETLHQRAAGQQIGFRIVMHGFRQQSLPPVDGIVNENLPSDDIITINSVYFDKGTCEELIEHFDRWLQSQQSFTCSLQSTPEETVLIEIAEREDLVTRNDHPSLTLYYAALGFRFECFFVLDHSCIRIARNELTAVLNKW